MAWAREWHRQVREGKSIAKEGKVWPRRFKDGKSMAKDS